jgi:hypothetical protein
MQELLSQGCIEQMREAVAALERAGRDATTAKRLLTISEKAFELYVADRVRLTKTARQSQNLTQWGVLRGRESPTYQPRAKSIPRAEKRP